MRTSRSRPVVFVLLAVALVVPTAALGATAQAPASEPAAPAPEPTAQDVYVVMRDMDLAYENVTVRTIVPNEDGVNALVGLTDGTLVDVVMSPTAAGWTLRDIYYVAGDAQQFQAWTGPWRSRVAQAERFLAAATGTDGAQRRPEELAPLIWFEDVDDDDRLWGLNPTTYRIMQTLKMMPNLMGPMGGDGSGRNR